MKRSKRMARRSPRRDGGDRDVRRSAALSKANPPRPPAPPESAQEPADAVSEIRALSKLSPPRKPLRRKPQAAPPKPTPAMRKTVHPAEVPTTKPRKRAALDVPFVPERRAKLRVCERCGTARATGWHHWVPQQHLRAYVRSLRLPTPDGRALLRRLIHDWRNLTALCDDCHGNGDETAALCAEDVPASAHEFAATLGPEWVERLAHRYKPARS